jgi:hypothetical protein
MAKFEPYLALDSAGERTILCDYPIKMFDNTIKPESDKMTKTTLSSNELSRYVSLRVRNPAAADRYWARCMGQDSAIDDEAAARIKEFLKGKLSAADHETLCSMIDGDGEAPDDVEGKPAMDGLDDFFGRFPDAARINIDNSGIQPRARAASHLNAAGAKSFYEMFPRCCED